MFKIEHGKSKTLQILANEFYSKLNPSNNRSLKKRLEKKIKNVRNIKRKRFYKELSNNNYNLLKQIIVGSPNELTQIQNHFNSLIASNEINAFSNVDKGILKSTKFGIEVLDFFNYKACRGSLKFNWLVRELDIPVCPYCNEIHTFQIQRPTDELILHEFDHFIPKVIAPYLSLSFYNLIPTCHTCNSPLKSSIIFSLSDYVHPYHDDLNSMMKFSINKSVDGEDINSFNIIIKKLTIVENEINKIINHNEVFQIIQRYSNFKSEIIRINKIKENYPSTYKKQLQNSDLFGEIIVDKDDLNKQIETVLNIPTSDLAASKMAFGKFKKDIATEFKILD